MAKKKRSKVKFFIVALIPISVIGFFIATGFHYIPVDVTLGKCMMDYTSLSAYTKRLSPLESLEFELEESKVIVCYGSPSLKARKVFGGIIPFDQLWRLGANEPTRFYTKSDLVLGEVVVPKGRYSLYAIPGKSKWQIFISRSTNHWGNSISESVREQEIGSFEVEPETTKNVVENFTIRTVDEELIIEWERTRIRIPIVSLGD